MATLTVIAKGELGAVALDEHGRPWFRHPVAGGWRPIKDLDDYAPWIRDAVFRGRAQEVAA